MMCPVGPIHLALYYHNDSGGHWDAHCKAHLASVGIEQSPNWKSTSRYPEHKHFLIVYVDDFQHLVSQGITLERPEPIGSYLDCRRGFTFSAGAQNQGGAKALRQHAAKMLRRCGAERVSQDPTCPGP